MDRLSVIMVRTSLVYLFAGILLGGFLLTNEGLASPLAVPPLGLVHAHLLFVGWLLQFALGIAYWLLPRRRTPANPEAYSFRLALTGYFLLNAGLLLRVLFEPLVFSGLRHLGWLLILSGSLQVASALVFVGQLWRRVLQRQALSEPRSPGAKPKGG